MSASSVYYIFGMRSLRLGVSMGGLSDKETIGKNEHTIVFSEDREVVGYIKNENYDIYGHGTLTNVQMVYAAMDRRLGYYKDDTPNLIFDIHNKAVAKALDSGQGRTVREIFLITGSKISDSKLVGHINVVRTNAMDSGIVATAGFLLLILPDLS